ncbi:MAG: phosphatase PAP2 family protein [Alphaproteobacteria bacterium]|nr:phosphatase PAP2 family protein [Alphaproteobacteria bacterium]
MSVRKPIAAAILAGVVAAVAGLILGGGDEALARALRDVDPGLKRAAAWISRAGEPTAYLIASAAVAAYGCLRGRHDRARRLSVLAFAAVAASGILVNLLKFLFGRTRPGSLLDRGVVEFLGPTLDSAVRSFPSGHAATVGAVAALVWLFWPRWRAAALLFALAVAVSRLLVGYHFASDVIAGLAVGWVSVALTRHVFVRQGWWQAQAGAYAPPRNDR